MPSLPFAFTSLLILPLLVQVQASLDCELIRVKDVDFNLKNLGGPKTVHDLRREPPSIVNTTFTIDVCATLKKPSGAEPGSECETGTRVCAKEHIYNGGQSMLSKVIPIAGEYQISNGRHLDPKYTRLKGSVSHSDSEREGLIMELHGGKYDDVDQKAIVEFVCDKELTGNEGFEDEKMLAVTEYGAMRTRAEDQADDDAPSLPDLDKGKSLQFVSYKREDDFMVLRLSWKTKYGCEDAIKDGDGSGGSKNSTKGWGFFTWFIIIAFLLAAAYIIFGSWLNYNRYGARGWDLIPHGDTIRDIPYVVKDIGSNLMDRLKGDSRGGYSAV